MGCMTWDGEHDAFPAHKLYVNHEFQYGFMPYGNGSVFVLYLMPVFPNIEFTSHPGVQLHDLGCCSPQRPRGNP